MIRYLRLYAAFVRFSVSRAMEFRFDFFFRVIMDLLYYAVNIAFYRLLFLHTPVLAGWTEAQAMVFVAGYLVMDAIQMTLFSNNIWWLPTLVNRGDLDYVLVRPVSSLFFVSLRDFAANSFINLLFSLGILAWAIARYPGGFTAARALAYLALIGVGTVLHYCLHLLALMPVFWTHSARGFETAFWSLSKLSERPDRIFRGGVRLLLSTAIPVCVVASFPARLVLEPFEGGLLIHFLGVIGAFFALTVGLWNLAVRSYSSASS